MVYLYIGVMALVTYLIRVIPLTVFRKKIENRYIRSFLYYVPYTCLTAMTFPAILYATASVVSALAGVAAAAVFAFRDRSLVMVAAAACLAVFVTEQLLSLAL
ncbi:MAG: AzlD domain-containing protein [Lachnospiraceae bacterium]|nr:AzlD domain-containing protein [Lachnospiraceae bacterium]